MTKTQTASEQISDEVTSWPGVEAGPGSRGEFAFKLGRRELGHLHGDHAFHTCRAHRIELSERLREHLATAAWKGRALRL